MPDDLLNSTSSAMKVGINAVLIDSHNSGARQRELTLLPEVLERISRAGHEPLVYVSRDLSDQLLSRIGGGDPRVRVVRTPLASLPTYKRIVMGLPYWKNRVKKDRIDVFHTTYFPIPRVGAAVVVTVNDVRFVHFPETYPRNRMWFLRAAVPYSLRRAARVVAISADTKKDLMRTWNLGGEKIDVVHIPVDPRYRPIRNRVVLEDVLQRLRLPPSFILAVGHLEPRKNLARLVRAYFLLRETDVVAESLVIVGREFFGNDELRRTLQSSVFSRDIRLTGYVADEDLPALYSLAKVLVFPSLHEGFGLPVIEAMACGTPVVTSNVSALPEVAGDAAVLVDPYRVESIAAGIASVLSSTSLRGDLVDKGLLRAKQFAPAAAAVQLVETYEKAYCATGQRGRTSASQSGSGA